MALPPIPLFLLSEDADDGGAAPDGKVTEVRDVRELRAENIDDCGTVNDPYVRVGAVTGAEDRESGLLLTIFSCRSTKNGE